MVKLMRDKLGQEIRVGDVIAYPGMRGDTLEMRLYDVLEVRENNTLLAWKQGLDYWNKRSKKVTLWGIDDVIVVTSLIKNEASSE
jgi:hypothetical protein